MIRHVCLFRLARALSTEEQAELQRFANQFLASSADITAYRFTSNASRKAQGFDLVLYSEFTSAAALADYVGTSMHSSLAMFMERFVEQTIVADIASG